MRTRIIACFIILIYTFSCRTRLGDQNIKLSISSSDSTELESVIPVIKDRLIAFGVWEEDIRFSQNKGQLELEIDGIDNKDKIYKAISTQANLEFWSFYEIGKVLPSLEELDSTIKADSNNAMSLYQQVNQTITYDQCNLSFGDK